MDAEAYFPADISVVPRDETNVTAPTTEEEVHLVLFIMFFKLNLFKEKSCFSTDDIANEWTTATRSDPFVNNFRSAINGMLRHEVLIHKSLEMIYSLNWGSN